MLKKVFLSALLSQNAEDAILKVSPTIAPVFFVGVVRGSSKLLRICGADRAPLQ
jgi:hypothetical protein